MKLFFSVLLLAIANGETTECYKNKDCLSNTTPQCRDGSCICQENTCQVVECTRKRHCSDQEICESNICKAVECTANRHCNDCRFSGARQVCDKNSKKCVKVECVWNNDCGAAEVCFQHSCRKVECKKNSHCQVGEICSDNRCQAVECLSDINCGNNEFCNSNNLCQEQ
ncbi:Oidioi.mRNA.OKI2018_I69.chr2.g4597.t1.cds [Oikopleura dioica]|uniref:Oidioi.mRNA.OKI2018_I69.chr2.g4597.t1.cds n=1 Tax=Oikopleura dioica TaxID=34765 RepID=A0ABN7SZE9_OIKDI|nr:Oidioi.mRNA.OKI2018_I69.chr2.g4597.t1.cds [Oikopleura dioica]